MLFLSSEIVFRHSLKSDMYFNWDIKIFIFSSCKEGQLAPSTDYLVTSVFAVVIKVMWTDYKYSAVYTCDEVLDDDSCAPNKDYIDVLARDLEPIPVTVIERLKRVLKRACYEPGDLVESDHDGKGEKCSRQK